MKKKIVTALIMIAILTVVFAISVSAAEPVESWDISATENDSVIANLYEDAENEGYYMLTVSGTGTMMDMVGESAPWFPSYGNKIVFVTVEGGVTSIGSNFLAGCTSITTVLVSDTVAAIGENAFAGCTALTVYAEAKEQPSGWALLNCPVEWNYKNALLESVFTFKGYSFGSGDAMAVGYDINRDAIKKYKAITRQELVVGAAFASFELLNGVNPIDNEGNIVTLPQGQVAARVLNGYNFNSWEFVLTGITDELKDHSLVISAYLYDGTKTRFVQENGVCDTVTGVTYNELTLTVSVPISTAADLEKIRENPSGIYHLTNDIDLKSNSWTPISEFSGVLDGRGYKISNMKLNIIWRNGAFIENNYGTVKNLSFENTNAYLETPLDNAYFAIIASTNFGKILNCHTYGGAMTYYVEAQRCSDTSGYTDMYLANIAAMNKGVISDCSAKVKISGMGRAPNYHLIMSIGGVAAYNYGDGSITNCSAELTIAPQSNSVSGGYKKDSSYRVGGLVGVVNSGKIEKSYANCTITTDYGGVYDKGHGVSGGLMGYLLGGTVDQCYSKGSISLSDKRDSSVVGGFVGTVSSEQSLITNSYSNTSVYCTGSSTYYHLGSFCGYMPSGEIKNCYTTGSMSYKSVFGVEMGTLVARFHGGAIRNCISTLTGKFASDGVKENCANANDHTLEELKSASFIYDVIGFDREIWIADGENMPILAWQIESEN